MPLLTVLTSLILFAQAGDQPALRSVQVKLPRQDHNVIKTSWPGIGCWFWKEQEFQPEGYKRFLDLHEAHSGYRLLTTSIRYPVEVTDAEVHDQIKAAAQYAEARGMSIVMDLDVRLARRSFMQKHPDEMQEIVRLRETPLQDAGWATINVEAINLADHYTHGTSHYESVSSRLLRVYSYVGGEDGIDPASVKDITDLCMVAQADRHAVKLAIPCTPDDAGRTACVMAAFTLFAADVFAPHLIEFEREVLQQYADVPLAGACKDEWGFPGRFRPRWDDMYYSQAMADVYAQRHGGRDLVRDLLLMVKGERGRRSERIAAINHYMEMNWQRNAEVETAFYRAIKEVFGPQAMSATHPTWYPMPTPEEALKNGMSWWACTRDLAQTDEVTPFSARTALAKKWHSPLWYNMYYDKSLEAYGHDLWSHALGGGRMNFHPQYPRQGDMATSLLGGRLMQADARVRLLNYISTAPVDCQVAVIFGHESALNWTDPGFADVGLEITNGLWEAGQYADLIPSSEIPSGALTVSDDGYVQYGPQKYLAAVLYHPQYGRQEVAQFWRRAGEGRTKLYHRGDWTVDFEGQPFDASHSMERSVACAGAGEAVAGILTLLKDSGVEPQTACTMHSAAGFNRSMMPGAAGRCRLLDGTRIIARGQNDVMGDPIIETVTVGENKAAFDAVGVAAVRFDAAGELKAMAAGGLKSFRAGELSVELDQRADVALWRDANGQWQGVIQGLEGPIPAALSGITNNWARLRLPMPLNVK